MDRALDPELLAEAMGQPRQLPSSEELAKLIAEAELGLLLQKPEEVDVLKQTAWYLLGIASSPSAFELYGPSRARSCFQVAAHVFDIVLRTQADSEEDRLLIGFASEVCYVRAELEPNAKAIYEHFFESRWTLAGLVADGSAISLQLGIALLGLDTRRVMNATATLMDEVGAVRAAWGVDSVMDTVYAGPAAVAMAVRALCIFLLYGDSAYLERAREWLSRLLRQPSDGDTVSRWVAYHLQFMADGFAQSSIWTALPPAVPPGVRRAFAMAEPRILSLWPPQLALFRPDQDGEAVHPLAANVRRTFLATPTSSGKTLIAQLIIASHLNAQGTGVCYVAPTRTLCQEVRTNLERRLRFMARAVEPEAPDFLGILPDARPVARVEVMTPERLAQMLRSDPQAVLDRFGLFVFDEVHNVGGERRGWTLESVLSFIHHATLGTGHKLVLMSAAVGNQHHFVSWVSDGKPMSPQHLPWRGPRRMHCIWTTTCDWNDPALEPGKSSIYPALTRYPIFGELHVRLGAAGQIRHLATDQPLGSIAYRTRPDGSQGTKESKTTGAEMLMPLVKHLGASGPVLIVESTRPRTVQMAKALAAALGDELAGSVQPLVDLATLRVGADHPLVGVLNAGVAYHHGSLPAELRVAIEESVREGDLNYLVATTTMTEGVNLPVRSVVVASQGVRTKTGYKEFITGPSLINAIGRAGRATKETDGIVVLVREAEYSDADFERLDPDEDDYAVSSWLASSAALQELAEFEERLREGQDQIVAAVGEVASSFMSFVWFVCAELERTTSSTTVEGIDAVLRHTLAWVQLSDEARESYLKLATATAAAYQMTPAASRKRWAKSDRALTSSSTLEAIAGELGSELGRGTTATTPEAILDALLTDARLKRLLALPENPNRRVYDRRGGQGRTDVTPDLAPILRDWLAGAELTELAKVYFSKVPDGDFKFEQLGDFVNDYFEVFLPPVFATIIDWANELILELETDGLFILPTELPAYVRWGINDRTALELMRRGMTSRRVARLVSAQYREELRVVGAAEWLGAMTIEEIRSRFEPSIPELRNILDFTGRGEVGIAARLLDGEDVVLPFYSTVADLSSQLAELVQLERTDFAPISVVTEGTVIGTVSANAYPDLQAVIRSGYRLTVEAVSSGGVGELRVRLVAPARALAEEQ